MEGGIDFDSLTDDGRCFWPGVGAQEVCRHAGCKLGVAYGVGPRFVLETRESVEVSWW